MPPAANARLYRFGIYEVDVRSGELRKNGAKLKLQEQPFQVLAMLLERPGEVLTRDQLRQRLWPADTFVDFDHSLNTAINKLRDALGDSAANPRFIETLAKRGYRFIAPVAPPLSLPAEPALSAIEGAQGGEVPDSTQRPPGAPPSAAECAVAVARSESRAADGAPELPKIDRRVGRALLALIQVMYLSFYIVSLAKVHEVYGIMSDWKTMVLLVLTAVMGIPTRLYLLAAVSFDYRKLGKKFRRLFWFLLPLDVLWALAPFLLVGHIGFGLAFAATAALLYVPFSQRTLIRMTYSAPGS
ncbi:MAG TPA: winged helix-turn-helix domain-containing protein [Terriglobales bacterium]